MVGAKIEGPILSTLTTSPMVAAFATPRMMDLGHGYVVQSPTAMAQHHDQLPSPLIHDAHGSLAQQIDMPQSPHVKMRRKSIKGTSSLSAVKRSASSPNVRGLSSASETAMSLAEKRRNKLGYHRTSVACVHCRRRKIRCLLAPDDPQKRCSNCIRLKKECNFFPVDQQPPVERRPRAGSKQEGMTADTSTSSSSSPSLPTPHIGEHGEPFNYQHMPMSAHPFSTTPIHPFGATTMSPPGSAAPITTHFDIPEHHPGAGWDPRFFDGQQIPTGQQPAEDRQHQNGYWKVTEPPMTPAFSPSYSSGPPSSMFHNGSFSSYSSAPSRPESGWQPHPMRSMSYGGHIDEQHHRQDSYHAPYHSDMRRSTVDMLPPASYSSTTSSAASMAESPVTPAHAPQPGQPIMHYNAPPGWNAVPSQSPKTMEFTGGWYSEPGHLSKVQEEDVAQFSDRPPPPMYASTGPH